MQRFRTAGGDDILLRFLLGLIGKFIALAIALGLPFWWFMVQLAEHGWK